jgi:predicted RecB family nuclease
LKDDPNPFVELLWEQGVTYEEYIVEVIGITANMKVVDPSQWEAETRTAMQRREPLIYDGRLTSGDLVGEPDLLELSGSGYIPGDIKSGSGFDGEEIDGKLKRHYAFQLAHYALILEQLGLGNGSREAFIIDSSGRIGLH